MHLCHATDGHCGDSTNQKITTNAKGEPTAMTEIGTEGLGHLPCTIYTNGNYTTTRSVSSVSTGEYIYWTTSSGGKVWHHQGRVEESFPGHPNRS